MGSQTIISVLFSLPVEATGQIAHEKRRTVNIRMTHSLFAHKSYKHLPFSVMFFFKSKLFKQNDDTGIARHDNATTLANGEERKGDTNFDAMLADIAWHATPAAW